MQKQQQRKDRQQTSPMSYSPDISSPESPNKMLSARFDHNSKNQQFNHAQKENFIEMPLPIFQDDSQMMIPKVSVVDSTVGCEAAQVLSDLSDERLIQQLQLNMKDKPMLHDTINSLDERSIVEGETKKSIQPFHNRTNSIHMKSQFSTIQSDKKVLTAVHFYSSTTSNVLAQQRKSAPEPHPYPTTASHDHNDSLTATEMTMPTDKLNKQSSPAISQDSPSVQTETAQFQTCSLEATCETQKKEKMHETAISVRQFTHRKRHSMKNTLNSTIEEQPTLEQLHASGTATRNKRHTKRASVATTISTGHHTQRPIHHRKTSNNNSNSITNHFDDARNRRSVPQPTTMTNAQKEVLMVVDQAEEITGSTREAAYQQKSDIQLESESMMQVRMLSEATTTMHHRGNSNAQAVAGSTYSPSGSLQDLLSPPNGQLQSKNESPMMNQFEKRRGGPEIQPEQSASQVAAAEPETLQQESLISVRPVSSGATNVEVKSPIRHTALYGSCAAPSEQLFKPILRGSINSGANSTPAGPLIRKANSIRTMYDLRGSQGQTSQSPVSRATSPSGSTLKRTSLNKALNGMLQKQAFTMRSQSRELQQILSESRRKQTLFARKSPSPAAGPLSRTRNGFAHRATLSTMRQTSSQKSIKLASQETTQQQPAPAVDFSRTIQTAGSTSITAINSTARSPLLPRPYHNTITAENSRRQSDMLDQEYQQQIATVSTPTPTTRQPQISVPMRSSLYQIRRAIDGMRALDIQMFIELERIKKPTAAVLAITRMSCIFFEALRQRDPIRMDQVEKMQSWQQIQQYMSDQLMCCVPELRTLLKKRIIVISKVTDNQIGQKHANIKASMHKINETFFSESKMRVIRRFTQTSKSMRQLVSLIHAIVCLVLDLERDFSSHNLLKLADQPVAKFDDVKQLLEFNASFSRTNIIDLPCSSNILDITNQQQEDLVEHLSREQSKQELHEVDPELKEQSVQSVCSKCSCHLKQSQQSIKHSRHSLSINGSQERLQVVNQEESPQAKFEMQNQVFRTLEQMFTEKQNDSQELQTVRQSNHGSLNHESSGKLWADNCGGEGGEAQSPSQFLSVKNYTTVQLPKPYQSKVRTSTPDDLKGVMSIMEEYTPEASKEQIKKVETIKPTIEANDKPSKSQNGRNSRRQFSLVHLAKLSQPKHKQLRKESVNPRQDFVSVVRASAHAPTAPMEEIVGAHTPKLNRAVKRSSVTPTRRQVEPTGTTTKRLQTRNKPVEAVTVTSRISTRKDVSPITPSRAQKTTRNTSLKGFQTIGDIVPAKPSKAEVFAKMQNKTHVRNSTLYKSTASAAAKQVLGKQAATGQAVQRDTSGKALIKNQPQQPRKTKSQTLKQSTTRGRQQAPDTTTIKQYKRQTISRNNIGSTQRTITACDLAEFVATEQKIQMEHKDNVIHEQIETMPSFGGNFAGENSITEENKSRTTRISVAPPMNVDFTPDITDLNSDLDQHTNIQVPLSQSQNMNTWFSQNNKQQEVIFSNDSIDQSISMRNQCTIDERQEFIMAKAQAITENINSCYRQHNMPQIDMATIQRLKMRRMQMMHNACTQGDKSMDSAQRRVGFRNSTESFTVQQQYQEPYQTLQIHDEQMDQRKEEYSFTDALNKLKVEVESLMQHRQKRT